VKAKTLAAWCWARGITSVDLAWAPSGDLAAVARAAGVNPPSTGETWALAGEMLRAMAGWVTNHPGDPRAARGEYRPCCVCRPLACAIGGGRGCAGCRVCLRGCPAPVRSLCCTNRHTATLREEARKTKQ